MNNDQKRIRIAQVGTNGITHASQTFTSIRRYPDVFEFVGLAEPVDEWKHKLDEPLYRDAPHTTVEQLLADNTLDAVAIETNEEYMTEYAQLFADRGVAVHMDKPGSPDSDAFERLAKTLAARGLPLHMGYMYRFNPLIKRALDLVSDGTLGDILYVEAQMSCLHTADMRTKLSKFEGGMMYYLGCHLIDLVCLIQGMPLEVLPFNCTSNAGGIECEDSCIALLKYPNGMSTVKSTAVEVNGFSRRQLIIVGTNGTVEIMPLEELCGGNMVKSYGRYTPKSDAKSWSDCSTKWVTEPFDRYDAMMLDFADIINGRYQNPYTPEYETALHRCIMKACKRKP